MTVHPVRMTGLVLGVPQTMSYFEQMQERIVRFVADNSRISADRFRSLMLATGQLVMDVGTVLDGEAAVKEGLIDSLGSLSDALDKLCDMIEEQSEKKGRPGDALHSCFSRRDFYAAARGYLRASDSVWLRDVFKDRKRRDR